MSGASRVGVYRIVLRINRSFVQARLIVRYLVWQLDRGVAPSTRKLCQLSFSLHGQRRPG
jgi:hypothetical protein